jgi:hypothetical protein
MPEGYLLSNSADTALQFVNKSGEADSRLSMLFQGGYTGLHKHE